MQEALCALVCKAFADVTVHTEADVQESARYLAREESVDLVLLDHGLPGHDGLEALWVLKQARSRIPVVIVSANDERESIVNALKAGVAGYITKTSPQRIIVAALRLVAAGGIYLPAQCIAYLEARPASAVENTLVEKLTDAKDRFCACCLKAAVIPKSPKSSIFAKARSSNTRTPSTRRLEFRRAAH